MNDPPPPADPLPSDLTPHEARIAAWLSGVDRTRPPAELESALLEAYASALRPRGPWPRPGTWVGALGAVLLVGLGLGALAWFTSEAARQAEPQNAVAPRQTPVVVDDPTVPLYPGMDSFDAPGAAGEAVIGVGDAAGGDAAAGGGPSGGR